MLPYKLPVAARIIDFDIHRRITWDVRIPGLFSAKHATLFTALGENSCRVGWWELADGLLYRLGRLACIAHFRYVCRETFLGLHRLAAELRASPGSSCPPRNCTEPVVDSV
jgi:hypothetical protein